MPSEQSFDDIWTRITKFSSEIFHTKTELEFSYRIDKDSLYPSRTDYRISKGDFSKAFKLVPFDGPGVINHTVRGPAYVWAILHDGRISQGEW